MILPITMKDKNYDVVVKKHALDEIEKYLDLKDKLVLILTDSNVPEEYSIKIAKKCKQYCSIWGNKKQNCVFC